MLAQVWEMAAPDLDPDKPFAEQDPAATLESDQYKGFKSRFLKLAADLDMPGGDAKAQEICETLQDSPANGLPHSLVQRAHAPASPGKGAYVGEQFKHTSMDQMVELTKVKIDNVTERIRYMLNLAPTGTAGARPTNHDIYTKIVNPGLVNDLIAKISSTALAEATSAVPATSYPP